jgi:hypothetical protein
MRAYVDFHVVFAFKVCNNVILKCFNTVIARVQVRWIDAWIDAWIDGWIGVNTSW